MTSYARFTLAGISALAYIALGAIMEWAPFAQPIGEWIMSQPAWIGLPILLLPTAPFLYFGWTGLQARLQENAYRERIHERFYDHVN